MCVAPEADTQRGSESFHSAETWSSSATPCTHAFRQDGDRFFLSLMDYRRSSPVSHQSASHFFVSSSLTVFVSFPISLSTLLLLFFLPPLFVSCLHFAFSSFPVLLSHSFSLSPSILLLSEASAEPDSGLLCKCGRSSQYRLNLNTLQINRHTKQSTLGNVVLSGAVLCATYAGRKITDCPFKTATVMMFPPLQNN